MGVPSMNFLVAAISKFLPGSTALVLVMLCCPASGRAQASSDQARPKAVPALDDFAQIPLPRGNFKGWCGRKDRFLIGFNGEMNTGGDRGRSRLLRLQRRA